MHNVSPPDSYSSHLVVVAFCELYICIYHTLPRRSPAFAGWSIDLHDLDVLSLFSLQGCASQNLDLSVVSADQNLLSSPPPEDFRRYVYQK